MLNDILFDTIPYLEMGAGPLNSPADILFGSRPSVYEIPLPKGGGTGGGVFNGGFN